MSNNVRIRCGGVGRADCALDRLSPGLPSAQEAQESTFGEPVTLEVHLEQAQLAFHASAHLPLLMRYAQEP
jgi:hypothetical protein